jgi:catechol 2,3-dioxygenase-like lactoylglutathione lyase family enzyme
MTTSQQTPAQPPAEPPAQTPPHAVRFGRVAVTVQVTDLERALAFYVGVLGFEKVFENGDPVGFVILEKDAAELHLDLDPTHRASARNIAHLMVEDANGLYEHLVAHGIRIVKGIRDADYGMRTFVLADPDGNRVDVGQDL